MGVELDRAAVEDEQGLEDAVAGIGHVAIVATSGRLKTLLIDNYDSFTFNLFQLLGEVNGEQPVVVRNDEASWAELAGHGFDNVVISPGPGRPERDADFGVCAEAIRESAVPLLGVCIGHQGIGALHGAAVVPAPEPMHGRLSAVLHDDAPLFAGIPREFQAVRYHSLCVEQPLPARAARDRLDKRRRADGARTSRAAALGRPVPPGVGLRRAWAAAARELSGFERGFQGPFFGGFARGTAGTLPPGQSPV